MSDTLRCATYGRYSTDRQNPLSAEDQIRKCREHAAKQNWLVLEDYVYRDEAFSGTNDDRPGLKRLLAAALLQPRPFDVLLIDDTSRLSRNMKDTLTIVECLKFAGIRLVCVSQGIDTQNKQADLLLKFHGIIDSSYVTGLIEKTKRGMESAFLRKMHVGGRCFGYRNVLVTDPSRADEHGVPLVVGAKLAIDPEEAAIVRRIFTLYADGYSLTRTAKFLNAEHIRSPQPRDGREQSWCPSSIRVILRNDRYRGLVTWGRTRKESNPRTGRKVRRPSDPAEVRTLQMPEQRIVSDELWNQVHERIAHVKQVYGDAGRRGGLLRGRSATSPYLFSGLLKCGTCGARITLVAGRGKNHRQAQYGCPRNASRGTCRNTLRVGREDLERQLLAHIQEEVLRPEVIAYALDRFEQELKKALRNASADLARMREQKARIERRLGNYMRVIGDGHYSPAVMAEVAQCEQELAEISNRLLSGRQNSIAQQMRNIRDFALGRLADVRALLGADAIQSKAEIAKHIQTITLEPDGRAYKVSGSWDLLGTARMECAGGQS
jgi:site-specific DNA recombinase